MLDFEWHRTLLAILSRRRARRSRPLFVLIFLCIAATAALADTKGASPELMPGALLLEDTDKTLSFDAVEGLPDTAFRRVTRPLENLGYPTSAYWLRIHLSGKDVRAPLYYLELSEYPDRVDLYVETAGDAGRALVSHVDSGRARPFSERALPHRRLVLPFRVVPGEPATLTLRYETEDSLVIAPELFQPARYAEVLSDRVLAQGAYYGVLLVMVVYNLFLYFSVRDRAYLLYVLFQGSFATMQSVLDHIAFQYFWPNAVEWGQRSVTFFAGLSFFGGIGFCREFLATRKHLPRVDRVIFLFLIVAAAITATSVFVMSAVLNQFALAFLISGSILLLLTSVLSVHHVPQSAMVFGVAWLALLVGNIVFSIRSLGIIPATALTDNALKVGSAIEATVLSLGLANRINLLQREREEARRALLAAQKSREEELERRVAERTRELEAAQRQLLHQGRLASMGHLVAGVAHEIGNPLNVVSGGARVAEEKLRNIEESGAGPESIGALHSALSLVTRGTDRIAAIVEHLRAFLHSGAVGQSNVDVGEALGTTVELLRTRLEKRGIEVNVTLPENLVVDAPRGEVQQIFMNLLINAWHALPEGGEIRIDARVEGSGRAVVRIADTGSGVPEHLRDQIFDAFMTTRDAGDGTGLGLSISSEIARRLCGSLSLAPDTERREGEGAVFVLELPLSAAESGDA